jgi:nicotinate phosphoribosyltransferase
VFGVGTKMGVAADAPYYDMAYKLVKYDGRPVMKLSPGKTTLVEEKQVWRCTNNGQEVEDIIALRRETLERPDAHALLTRVMQAGQVAQPQPSLDDSRACHTEQMARLPMAFKQLDQSIRYSVSLSTALARRQQEAETALQQNVKAAQGHDMV